MWRHVEQRRRRACTPINIFKSVIISIGMAPRPQSHSLSVYIIRIISIQPGVRKFDTDQFDERPLTEYSEAASRDLFNISIGPSGTRAGKLLLSDRRSVMAQIRPRLLRLQRRLGVSREPTAGHGSSLLDRAYPGGLGAPPAPPAPRRRGGVASGRRRPFGRSNDLFSFRVPLGLYNPGSLRGAERQIPAVDNRVARLGCIKRIHMCVFYTVEHRDQAFRNLDLGPDEPRPIEAFCLRPREYLPRPFPHAARGCAVSFFFVFKYHTVQSVLYNFLTHPFPSPRLGQDVVHRSRGRAGGAALKILSAVSQARRLGPPAYRATLAAPIGARMSMHSCIRVGALIASIIAALWTLPALALSSSASYADAERAFNRLSVNDRLAFKAALTAAGYWPVVADPNSAASCLRPRRNIRPTAGSRRLASSTRN